MGNYTTLKTTINANIRQNGNQEITGKILNSVLTAMVNTFGEGYQFAGIATAETDPGTPDAKVFYIANGKGKYTNFWALDVTEDDVVFLVWDNAWHKVATGIAADAQLKEAMTELTEIAGKVDTKQDIIPDLEAIREGAGKGSTALQKESDPVYLADKPSLLLEINGKVGKEAGKGLSSNDFTDTEKAKLAGLENYDDTEVRRLIGEKADETDLATVAKTGLYSDVLNAPTVASLLGDGQNTVLSQAFLSDIINRLYRLLGYNSSYSVVNLELGLAGKYVKCESRSAVANPSFAISKPFAVDACSELLIKTGFNPSDTAHKGLDLTVIQYTRKLSVRGQFRRRMRVAIPCTM